jgi:hypothetical protein
VSIAGVTLVASGYATAYSRLAIGSAIAQLVAVAVAARWGLMAVAWAIGVAQCLSVIPAIHMLSRYYQLSRLSLWAELAPILLLFGAGLGLSHWAGTLPEDYYPQPLASLAFCLVMGAGGLLLLRRERERAQRDSVLAAAPVVAEGVATGEPSQPTEQPGLPESGPGPGDDGR